MQRRHLAGRDHPRFVHYQDPVAQVRLLLGVDEEPLNRHRLRKPNLLQLVHGTPRRRHRQDVPSRLGQSPVELLQGGRLARAGGAAQTDRPVARGEHLVHGVLLVRPQPIGRQEGVIAAQPIEGADPPIDDGDHLSLAIETLARRDLMPDPEERARGLLQPQHALGRQRNPPAALSQRFGEDFVLLDDRSPFELIGIAPMSATGLQLMTTIAQTRPRKLFKTVYPPPRPRSAPPSLRDLSLEVRLLVDDRCDPLMHVKRAGTSVWWRRFDDGHRRHLSHSAQTILAAE
jgi:hypothetical protein